MKVILAITLILILLVVLAAPVLADQPADPGIFGQAVVDDAQNENGPGLSPEIEDSKAEGYDNLGQFIRFIHETYAGIPPKHTQ